MNDSVWVINTLVAGGPREEQTQLECNQEIDRNVRYLEIMLSKSYIQDAGRPLGTYQVAIIDGNAYIESHGGLTPSSSSLG